MRLKFLSFSNLTLLVALSLSSVAAWYSIIGLTAIFAGAVIPVIIMGSILEVGKITTTVWLRKYWKRCTWIMKVYLVPAVVALAVLTSMGIFGFLSKAHLDQGIPTGDVAAKVALFDEGVQKLSSTYPSYNELCENIRRDLAGFVGVEVVKNEKYAINPEDLEKAFKTATDVVNKYKMASSVDELLSNIKNDLRTEFLQNTNEIYRLRDIMLKNEVITKNDF